jgi:hypothetical protein
VKKTKKNQTKDIKVTHVMADGTIRDSVKGLHIPITNQIAYQLIAKYSGVIRPSEESATKVG